MRASSATKNPYLLFLPFLLFYILYIFIFKSNELSGDEGRYLRDAGNLLNGYFSPPLPDITLFNGPGYGSLILPFVAFKLPYILIKLLNAFFLYFSIVFLYKALIPFISQKRALIFCIFWGLYFNSYKHLPDMIPEVICPFFIALLLFSLTRAFRQNPGKNTRRYLLLSGLVFGYLALIKVIFGYVLICMIIGCGVLWIINRKRENYRKSMIVLLAAFITVLPYLAYTYHITGRAFYWSSMGGNNLYWMSAVDEQEFGSWFLNPRLKNDSLVWNFTEKAANGDAVVQLKSDYLPGYLDSIALHNNKDLKEIALYKDRGLEQDDIYKKLALKNIKSHPVKFLKNCFSNAGRILFNFPYSYSRQKPSTLLRLPLNGIISVLVLLCLIPTIRNWYSIPFAIRFMLFVTFLYLGGSVLGSAEVRMFTVIVPALLAWIAYIVHKTVRMNFGRWDTQIDP